MRTTSVSLIMASLLSLAGCEVKVEPKGKPTRKTAWKQVSPAEAKRTADSEPGAADTDTSHQRQAWEERRSTNVRRNDFPSQFNGGVSSAAGAVGGRYPNLTPDDAIAAVARQVLDSLDQQAVLVVWIIDGTPSGQEMLTAVAPGIKKLYAEAPAGRPLTSAVVTFGGEVKFALGEPTADRAQVTTALDAVTAGSGGQELLFTAVKQAAEKFAPLRLPEQEVMLVVVTDEAGDDEAELEESLKLLKKRLMPAYVIGLPAPLGLAAVAGDYTEGKVERSTTAGTTVKFGPESRSSEQIALTTTNTPFDLADSGFGPWGLERLAQQTGAKFFAVRSQGKFGGRGWPAASATRFDPEIMKKYQPDLVSDAEYQALLAENGARQALVNAARLPSAAVALDGATRTFGQARNEAELKRRIDEAQRIAARLEPLVEPFYLALKEGEADRPKLTSPRWQAEFDCAYGRVLAAKARVDGYNAMLALLKSGKTFQNPGSSVWDLEPAEKSEAGSQIAKLGDTALLYLNRVKTDHPGTPWAALAEAELRTPMGWKWTER